LCAICRTAVGTQIARLELVHASSNLARLPSDIIRHLADEYESTCDAPERRKLGCNMSLVNREWRSIGQSLVFRHIRLSSLEVYNKMMRRLLMRSFTLAHYVRHLDIEHLTPSLPTSTALIPLFDRCTQLSRLTIRTRPREMSIILKSLTSSSARSSISRIKLEYVLSGSLDDFDDRDFGEIAKLGPLDVFSLTLPLNLGFMLPTQFKLPSPVQAKGFDLRYSGTASDKIVDQVTSSLLSMLAPETLRHLLLESSSTPQSLVDWLQHRTSLTTLHLVNDPSKVSSAIFRLRSILSTLPLLRSLDIRGRGNLRASQILSDSDLNLFLPRLPPWIIQVTLDAIIVDRSNQSSIAKFLDTRVNTALRRFEFLGRSRERRKALKLKIGVEQEGMRWFWKV